jgi:cytochrome c oxidase subunit 2
LQIPALTTRRSGSDSGNRPRAAFAFVAAAVVTAVMALPQSASANVLWPDGGLSPTVSKVSLLYLVVYVVGLIAVIGITLALLGAAREETDPDAPEVAASESSLKVPLIAGSAIFVVLAVLGIISFSSTSKAQESLAGTGNFKATPLSDPQLIVPNNLKPPKGGSYNIHVNAQQYVWRYTYPGVKGDWNTYSYHDMVIPAGVTVMLDVTSSDVEAAWWVPALGGSVDAVPGYNNKSWIRADGAGIYPGAGTVVNGTNYANMTTNVIALPPGLFLRWVAGKQIEISDAMKALGVERLSGEEAELITGQKATTDAAAQTESAETDETIVKEGE